MYIILIPPNQKTNNPSACFKFIDSSPFLLLLQGTHASVEPCFYTANWRAWLWSGSDHVTSQYLPNQEPRGRRMRGRKIRIQWILRKISHLVGGGTKKPFQSKRLSNYLPINSMWTAVQK